MRAIISTAVAVAIALHLVLGCCWHHAHVETAVNSVSKATTRSCCGRGKASTPSHAEEQSPNESRESGSSSCDEECDVIAVRAPDDAAGTFLFDAVFVVFELPLPATSASIARKPELGDCVPRPQSTRRQLRQLFLI